MRRRALLFQSGRVTDGRVGVGGRAAKSRASAIDAGSTWRALTLREELARLHGGLEPLHRNPRSLHAPLSCRQTASRKPESVYEAPSVWRIMGHRRREPLTRQIELGSPGEPRAACQNN